VQSGGFNSAYVSQAGSLNHAVITQAGYNQVSNIHQFGTANQAIATQR